MKFVLASLSLLAVVASGQWLESTVILPDSLGGMGWPQSLAYDSVSGTMYVGGEVRDCHRRFDPPENGENPSRLGHPRTVL